MPITPARDAASPSPSGTAINDRRRLALASVLALGIDAALVSALSLIDFGEGASSRQKPLPGHSFTVSLQGPSLRHGPRSGKKVPAAPPVPTETKPSDLASPVPAATVTGSGDGEELPAADSGEAAAGTEGQASSSPAQRAFLLELEARIRENLVYPAAARRAGAEGTVVLKLSIGSGGQLLSRSLAGSSGNRHLDRAALELVNHCFPLKSPSSGPFAPTIRIQYSLD